jgi:hypothetical protein
VLIFLIKKKIYTRIIHFFKKAIITIKQIIAKESLQSGNYNKQFIEYILKNVYLLYNVIPDKNKAINSFISLNGLKAIMKDEELIKSEILIKASRIENEDFNKEDEPFIEWKINEDRSRFAHNWDKWLYWWNRDEIKDYYGTGKRHPLYYLLVTYWKINNTNNKEEFSYDGFKTKFLFENRKSKLTFEGLRKLQKSFEDFYQDPLIFNYLGLILKTSSQKRRHSNTF